jgi:hypothetical protein
MELNFDLLGCGNGIMWFELCLGLYGARDWQTATTEALQQRKEYGAAGRLYGPLPVVTNRMQA